MPKTVKRSLLVMAMTYPELSTRHRESACTAGVFIDDNSWCRIYPMPVRYMENRIHRWDVIQALLYQDPSSDPRPESWKIDADSVETINRIGTGKGHPPTWDRRKELALKPNRQFSSVEALEGAQRKDGLSLGMVQPRPGARVRFERRSEEDRKAWESKAHSVLSQSDLFQKPLPLDYIPVRPVIEFRCIGSECRRQHSCHVLDWEVIQLLRRDGQDATRARLAALLDSSEYDTRFFMGNFRQHLHSFGIVGLFYPKRSAQTSLF